MVNRSGALESGWRLVVLVVLFVAGCSTGFAAEDDSSFAGTYRDDKLTVELSASSGGDSSSYIGTIFFGQEKFPLEARIVGSRLSGSFSSQGDKFQFEGSIVGRILVLTTDGTTYRLKKHSSNPLARTAKPNPLGAIVTNSPPVQAAPVIKPAPAVTPAPIASSPLLETLRFQHYTLRDHPSMIGGDAFDFLIPTGWQVSGGVTWRTYLSAPVCLVMRVTDPGQTASWEVFPTIPFVWAEGGISGYPAGTNYFGNEVAEPIADPVAYVKTVLLPRFRRQAAHLVVVTSEEIPKVAGVIEENTREPAVEKKFRAVRVRVEYTENEKVMEEDIYCVLGSAYAPAIKATLWGAERNYSFRAVKGRLDSLTPTFQTMVQSLKPVLPWFNRYLQLVQILLQEQPDTSRHPGELGVYVVRTNDEVTDVRRQAYLRQEAARSRINAAFLDSVRGLYTYRNPFDGQPVQLPSGYLASWASPVGEYLLSNEPNYNPSARSNSNWQRLQRGL